MPISTLFGALEIFIFYWFYKYRFINYSHKPSHLNFLFIVNQIKNLERIIFSIVLGLLVFDIILLNKISVVTWILIFCVVFEAFILSVDQILLIFLKKETFEKKSYQ